MKKSLYAAAALAAAGASLLGVTAHAATTADAVQNLSSFQSDCNNDEPGRTFGHWQSTPVTRGAGGTAVYGWLVVGTYDTGFGQFKCVGVLPSGRTAAKGYTLSVAAVGRDDTTGKTSSTVKYVKLPQVVLDGEDDLSDVVPAVATVDRYDMATYAMGAVRLLG